jgi:hypothetical protein
MKQETDTKPVAKSFNKPAYVVFIIAGIYFLIAKDFSQAVTFWGLALVFDPFNIETPFQKRPFYQQAWLIVHLAITFALFIIMLLEK